MKKKLTAIIMAAAMLVTMAAMTTAVSAAEKYFFNFDFDSLTEAPWNFNVGDMGNGLTKSIVADPETNSKVMKLSGGSNGWDRMYLATSNNSMSSSSDAQAIELNFDFKTGLVNSFIMEYKHTNSEGTTRYPFQISAGKAKVAYDVTGKEIMQGVWYNVNIKTDCATGKTHTVVKALADGDVALDGFTLGQASADMLNLGLPLAMLSWGFYGADKEIYMDNVYLKEIDPGKVYEQTIVYDNFQDVDLSAENPKSKWDLSPKSTNVTAGYETDGGNIVAKLIMAGTGGWTYAQPRRIWGANTARCYKFEFEFKYSNNSMPPLVFQLAESGGESSKDYFTAATMNFAADTIKTGSTTEKFTFEKDTLYKFNLYYVPETGKTRAEVTDGVTSAMAVGTVEAKSSVVAARLSMAANIGAEEWVFRFDNFGVHSVSASDANLNVSFDNLTLDKTVIEEGTTTASVDVVTNAQFENYTSGAVDWLIAASYKDNRISDITLAPINPSNGTCKAAVDVSADDTRVAAFVWGKTALNPIDMVEITK